ncbi:MAG: cellulase family glycosylhydrolase [Lachnospiraceae bacterium]|nr:cellulase family glycosylhydrolase [Lachnospiraceae bacterium]
MICPVFADSEAEAESNNTAKAAMARPSVNGHLSVKDGNLTDQNGEPVVLRGVSTHGLTWFPDFVSKDLFSRISDDWNCNLVRLAMYSEEYVSGKKDESYKLVKEGIEAAIASDMYVIVDWHVLTEQDPNVYTEEAKDFFTTICSEYRDTPNIIYEICNEPNGETTWSDIKVYANDVIPVIRSICPESVILIGTPNYDKDLDSARRSPLDIANIMYVLHFYAGTHQIDLQRELIDARKAGMPVFVSECGLTESTGDGKVDYESSAKWFSLLEDENISFSVWSFSNKDENSALIRPTYDPRKLLTIEDLTGAGVWTRSLIKGMDPTYIPVPDQTYEPNKFYSFLTGNLRADDFTPAKDWPSIAAWIAAVLVVFTWLRIIFHKLSSRHHHTYDDIHDSTDSKLPLYLRQITLFISIFFTIVYLVWRVKYSIPKDWGIVPIIGNVFLLFVEILGFIESTILYSNLMHMKNHPLPKIAEDEYPDVDIFIATYNEPVELLRKTINGCNHLQYPDKSKVHVWLCDDNRRPEMRALAEEMNIGYFDRPDNSGAKAGNLNNALSHTSAPYIVTLDADMIPMSSFLMKTIPYFVDALKSATPDKDIRLGFLQTPQCFYQPDVFQYALYSEKNAPNEQDFFYRTVEVAKTSTNSVVYGGSNTILAREALEKVGGFYTKTITEDFATGMLIESNGYVSLAISEPLASGMAPDSYTEHIQQRKRWGRGVIGTAKQLHLFTRPGLTLDQRLSYLSSVIYWYSPVKSLIYLMSPLLYAVFAIPVFKCSWLDLLLFWGPMFIMQDVTLRVFSKNATSLKWSGIYETSIMPYLLIPVLKETFGISASVFEVTNKSGKIKRNRVAKNMFLPFMVFTTLSVFGIARSLYVFSHTKALGIFVLLFWLIRNLYYIIMSTFLLDGRDSDSEPIKVVDAEPVTLRKINDDDSEEPELYGVTTYMTAHGVKVFLDEPMGLAVADRVKLTIEKDDYTAEVTGIITGILTPRSGIASVYSVEIIDMRDSVYEYMQILYDRVPSLPQSLHRDLGIIRHLLVNVAHRILD